MFLVCNYLDVERTDSRTDGFVVEECGTYDKSLSDLVIVCREHRIENVKDWAHSQMGNKAKLFEQQFKINPTKAMTFVRLKANISSFTEEMVFQAGGVASFKELYNVKTAQTEEVVAEDVKNDLIPEEVSTEEEKVPVEDAPAGNTSVEEVPAEKIPVVEVFTAESMSENEEKPIVEEIPEDKEVHKEDTETVTQSEMCEDSVQSATVQEVVHKYVAEHPQCHTTCIYNTDGTFKGFTEGQILTMLEHLHTLDKRIALDTLNPKYILTKEELEESVDFLDAISPSVFKAFILYEMSQAESEIDRIRISSVLDRFSSYMSTMKV